ncbi:MAG: NUDIX domain-containing protein [Chloroflexi bacterium]|nr:NUDIX domain-containing protein [Chloroflexota bacterium]
MGLDGERVRAIALGVFRRGDDLLVTKYRRAATGQPFYRPLGGGIQFGERGDEALAREIHEELRCDVADLRHLATLESIFAHSAEPGHEIALIYEGRLGDADLLQRDAWEIQEDNGETLRVLWKPLDHFRRGRATLYPEGLLPLLTPSSPVPTAGWERIGWGMKRWQAWALYAFVALFSLALGMGVPFFTILLGFPLGWALVRRAERHGGLLPDLMGRVLQNAGWTTLFTFVILVAIWGPSLQLLGQPGFDPAGYGIPMILYEPRASFIGWLALMVVVSPALQLLATLSTAYVTLAWQVRRGPHRWGNLTQGE